MRAFFAAATAFVQRALAKITPKRSEPAPSLEEASRSAWAVEESTAFLQTLTKGLPALLVLVLFNLARTESGLRIRLPARIFNPPRCTAFGLFQWNNPCLWAVVKKRRAWAYLKGVPTWCLTPAEEVGLPIEVYREIWEAAMTATASPRTAARAIRLWHRSPAAYKTFKQNYDWSKVAKEHTVPIDRHLRGIEELWAA